MSGRHFNRALDCIRLAWLFDQGNVATAEYVNGRSEIGRGGGIRTPDPLLPKQMRYQAALRPDFSDYPTPAIRSADDLSTTRSLTWSGPLDDRRKPVEPC